jgi:hypothetical protein
MVWESKTPGNRIVGGIVDPPWKICHCTVQQNDRKFTGGGCDNQTPCLGGHLKVVEEGLRGE